MRFGGPGLIPAHAGKTTKEHDMTSLDTAHPRSRGENLLAVERISMRSGSSPLTRGKHLDKNFRLGTLRLIPAHAGKTIRQVHTRGHYEAHPRSRGENSRSQAPCACASGSSPLTRGKPLPIIRRFVRNGLIPAHAGKTRPWPQEGNTSPAHPRSRGENAETGCSGPTAPGSSPLTRGKLLQGTAWRTRHGLIPAHAGKTVSARVSIWTPSAHPRSRGENH